MAVTCTSDADCQADANSLPGGTVRRCNPDTLACELCDADAAAWDEPSWAGLGVRMAEPHAFVYGFASVGTLGTARFTASAYGDQDCDTLQSTFQVQGLVPGDEPCRLAAPAGLTLAPEGPLMSALAVRLTSAQQAAFVVTSLNPYQDEASSNLAAIVAGAVAFYQAQPDAAAWEKAAWRALGFSIPTEHAFIYETRWDDATGLLCASASTACPNSRG